MTTTTAAVAKTSAPGDGAVLVVPKAKEEEAMRQKIHENNSVDGGGQ